MKILKIVSLALVLFGAITTFYFANHSRTANINTALFIINLFVLSPYFLLVGIWLKIRNSDRPDSRISLFITTTFITVTAFVVYGQVVFNPGSSTDGLVFLFLPVYSLVVTAVLYIVAKAIINLVMEKEMKVRIAVAAVSGLVIVFLLFKIISGSADTKSNKNYLKRKLTRDIDEAKRKGVLVKELKYHIDSPYSSLDFHPYIERAFRYGEDTSQAELINNTHYPYRLGFNKFQPEGVFIFVDDEGLDRFDSATGSGFHGASGYLVNPNLRDTITLRIRRGESILGTIKVWE